MKSYTMLHATFVNKMYVLQGLCFTDRDTILVTCLTLPHWKQKQLLQVTAMVNGTLYQLFILYIFAFQLLYVKADIIAARLIEDTVFEAVNNDYR